MDKEESLWLFNIVMHNELKDINDELLKEGLESLDQYVKALIKQDIERSEIKVKKLDSSIVQQLLERINELEDRVRELERR